LRIGVKDAGTICTETAPRWLFGSRPTNDSKIPPRQVKSAVTPHPQTPVPLFIHAEMPLSNKASSKPLPPCPGGFPAGTDLQRAFQVCKNFESKGQSLVFRPDDILLDFTPVCASRVLGFALLCSSSDRGRDNLATEILNCNDDHVLLTELAHLYVYGLIRVCALSTPFCLLSY